MLEELKFVQGAVAKKDLVPELTHFHIADGRVTGYNGRLAISCPINLDFNASPAAAPFVAAISKCESEVALGVTQNGRLSVRSGAFRAYVDCLMTEFPKIQPSGEVLALPEDFLSALAVLYAFTSEDASRTWSQGVLFRGSSAFATNNVVLVERWLGGAVRDPFNIPKTTVAELLRVKEPPRAMQIADNAVTFHYDGDRWLWSLLYETGWPDLERVLNAPPTNMQPLPAGFFEALDTVAPFTDKSNYLWLHDNIVRTRPPGIDEGAVREFDQRVPQGVYNATHLAKLGPVANMFDYDAYPAPALFYGDKLRGAIIGVRP